MRSITGLWLNRNARPKNQPHQLGHALRYVCSIHKLAFISWTSPALLGRRAVSNNPAGYACQAAAPASHSPGLTPTNAEREERRRQAAVRLRAAFAGGVTAEADVLSLAAQLGGSAGTQLADQLMADPVDPARFMAGGCWHLQARGCWPPGTVCWPPGTDCLLGAGAAARLCHGGLRVVASRGRPRPAAASHPTDRQTIHLPCCAPSQTARSCWRRRRSS